MIVKTITLVLGIVGLLVGTIFTAIGFGPCGIIGGSAAAAS